MAGEFQYRTGLGSTGQYIISGQGYITGSCFSGSWANNGEQRVVFPRVAKGFTVINKLSTPILVHYVSRANTDVITYRHYITLDNNNDSFGFYSRAKEIYISAKNAGDTCEFELFCETTGIEADEMHALSGSGINTVD